MTTPVDKQILDVVFNMARLGLIEITKETRNGPQAVAQYAAALEQWRAAMEKQLADPAPTPEASKA